MWLTLYLPLFQSRIKILRSKEVIHYCAYLSVTYRYYMQIIIYQSCILNDMGPFRSSENTKACSVFVSSLWFHVSIRFFMYFFWGWSKEYRFIYFALAIKKETFGFFLTFGSLHFTIRRTQKQSCGACVSRLVFFARHCSEPRMITTGWSSDYTSIRFAVLAVKFDFCPKFR